MLKRWMLTILFFLGGIGYMGLEILWRGYTHWTMGLCGGICLAVFYRLDKLLPLRWIIQKATAGCFFVTALEFSIGCIMNLWLHQQVWDYSNMPNNLLGQICLPFSGIWFIISTVVFGLFAIVRILDKRIKNNIQSEM